jgi:hypothetical protein
MAVSDEPGVPVAQASHVLCAACRARFDPGASTTGDRVACPMCGETVVIAGIVAERRRVGAGIASPVETSRLRTLGTIAAFAALAAGGLAVCWWWDEAVAAFASSSR